MLRRWKVAMIRNFLGVVLSCVVLALFAEHASAALVLRDFGAENRGLVDIYHDPDPAYHAYGAAAFLGVNDPENRYLSIVGARVKLSSLTDDPPSLDKLAWDFLYLPSAAAFSGSMFDAPPQSYSAVFDAPSRFTESPDDLLQYDVFFSVISLRIPIADAFGQYPTLTPRPKNGVPETIVSFVTYAGPYDDLLDIGSGYTGTAYNGPLRNYAGVNAGESSFQFYIEAGPITVPEPSIIAMFAALGAVLAVRRRRCP